MYKRWLVRNHRRRAGWGSFLYTMHKQQFLELIERMEVQKVPFTWARLRPNLGPRRLPT